MTALGYILLPIGLAALFFSEKWLYRLFVFWTLFSATSAANIGGNENGSALQVWMFFGFLWLVRVSLGRLRNLSFGIDPRILGPTLWLLAFVLVAAFSLLMPIYINGSLLITSPVLSDGSQTRLFLTTHNVTQLLYLLFGCMIAIAVAQNNLREEDRQDTERVILIAAMVFSVWGAFQFVCNMTGIPYPDFILNNSGSASGKGFLEEVNGVGRISSAAAEPSVFAQSLLALLPLTIPALLRRGCVLSVRADRFCFVLFTLLLILSTSTSAYVGIVLVTLLVFAALVRTHTLSLGRATKQISVLALIVGGAVSLGIVAIPRVADIFTAVISNKTISGSGLERAMTIALAFEYFQQYPLLGIGWGSATSHDLLVKLFSNVGVLGTFLFLGAMYTIVRANWRRLGRLDSALNLSRFAWLLALLVLLVLCLVSGFPLAFGSFWLIIGMAISTSASSEKGLLLEGEHCGART